MLSKQGDDPAQSRVPGKRGRRNVLHNRVTAELRQQLADGRFPPGTKLPAFRTIAAEFGVSAMTVQRAFSSLEEEEYVYHLPGVGVFVKQRKSPADAASRIVVLAAADLGCPFGMTIACSVEKACAEIGWSVQILNSQADPSRELRNFERLAQDGIAGGILIPSCGPESIAELFTMQAKGVRFVVVDQAPPGLEVDLVQSDHEQAAWMATRYLIERGHRQIVMLTHHPVTSSIISRNSGYERACREAGDRLLMSRMIWLDQAIHTTGYAAGQKWLGGYTAVLPILKETKLPLAILAIDPYVGWGVYQACAKLELRIPEQVSVVGFDDIEVTHALVPAMTIVAQRPDEIGRAAVELLSTQASTTRDNTGPRRTFTRVVVDAEMIERQSVVSLPPGR